MGMRRLAFAITAAMLLQGCAAGRTRVAPKEYYQLGGTPLLGHFTKDVPFELWIGDVPSESNIYTFETEGPDKEVLSFVAQAGCPGAAVGDEYLVFVALPNDPPRGIVKQLEPVEIPNLMMSSCAKVDPKNSYFSWWVNR